MQQPLISVIIPTYNMGATLGVALQSILDQTYKNLEIIVVDDASTDDTKAVVRNFQKTHGNIVYVRNTADDPNRTNVRGRNINAGWHARNIGLDHATGKWVTFQDADDASLLNRIEVQYLLAERYGAAHVAIQCRQFKKEYIGKKLDVERLWQERGNHFVTQEELVALARRSRGPIIPLLGPLNCIIPFEWKRKRVINKLFFGTLDPFPGSGNCPLLKTDMARAIRFSDLAHRIWPSFMGRGADRDFNFKVALRYRSSMCFDVPLYLWNPVGTTTEMTEYEKYLY